MGFVRMPITLTLDLATQIGWSLGDWDTEPEFGTYRLPTTGKDLGRFAQAFDQWLSMMIMKHRPEKVVYESPILPQKTQIAVLRKLYGLGYHTELICCRHNIECREAKLQDIRKHFVGRGTGKSDLMKRLVFEECGRRGWDVQTTDEADALAILDYTLCTDNPAYAANSAELFR